jgi:hypothetical protein
MGWVYPSEIVPLYIRNKAVSLSTFFNWAANFSLTFFIPPAFEKIQWKVSTATLFVPPPLKPCLPLVRRSCIMPQSSCT